MTKVSCVGLLECRFSKCDLFIREGKHNVVSWMGRPKDQKVYNAREFILEGGVVYRFCKSRPFCVVECDACLFQMYLSSLVQENLWNKMS